MVIGVPVGFVNVVEAKEEIMALGVPYIVARGPQGRQQRGGGHRQRRAVSDGSAGRNKLWYILWARAAARRISSPCAARDCSGEADVVIYAGSLVNPELLKYAKPECEIARQREA